MTLQSGVPQTLLISGVDKSSATQCDERPSTREPQRFRRACFLHLNQTIEDV
jgi:hypothetical protein